MSIERLGGEGSGASGNIPYSKAVRAGDFVYLSGQIGFDENGEVVTGGIAAETRKTLQIIEETLKLADCTLDDVIKTTVWLDDARDFGLFNKTYATFFPNGKPARSTVESKLMIDAKIEIEVVAYKPQS
ncbi:MAG: RidA family protein [Rhodospirillales bacterium]|jgi:reactive intermediate/imine deaminase|tara:strand:+ start:107 stop:493 length:387 start_codon:yes stop_codon:yes gene_type:complete